jgi:hypothetical protein
MLQSTPLLAMGIRTLPEFKTLIVFIYGTIYCEIAINSFQVAPLASLPVALRAPPCCSRATGPFFA